MFEKTSAEKLKSISYLLFVATMIVLIWVLWPSLPKINLSDVVIVGVGASTITF